MLLGPLSLPAAAQNRLGGHIGFVLPIVTRGDETTTDISEDFTIGFPVGITVRTSDDFAFDLEFVPFVQNDPLHVDLTVHPGAIWRLDDDLNAGVRLAFEVNRAAWGFVTGEVPVTPCCLGP
jgi:hypothetical protein